MPERATQGTWNRSICLIAFAPGHSCSSPPADRAGQSSYRFFTIRDVFAS
jgi:hypothetical protein